MHQWLNARSYKLLEDLNNTPFTDDVDEIKLNLIRAAMREASVEMFQRASENSRKEIEKLNKEDFGNTVQEVQSSLIADVMSETEDLLAEAEPETSALNQTDSKPDDNSPASAVIKTDKPESGEANKPKIQISSSFIRRAE